MPTRATAPVGAPCWVDLMTSDTERSRAFYTGLFGWTAEEPAAEFGGYFNFAKDGVRVAGCMSAQAAGGVPDVWSVYLATDDARKTADAAATHGATIVAEPMAVGDLGTMAVLADAAGAGVGVWQPDRFPGLTVYAEPGTPSWFELEARDYGAAVAFYRDVFRWDIHVLSDTPEMRYTVLADGDAWLAGIGDGAALPDGVPARWSVYFGVGDTDATLARVVELGGSVLVPAEDTPYGRIATAADPCGARFLLVAPNGSMPARPS